jgi:hypothetical protein
VFVETLQKEEEMINPAKFWRLYNSVVRLGLDNDKLLDLYWGQKEITPELANELFDKMSEVIENINHEQKTYLQPL